MPPASEESLSDIVEQLLERFTQLRKDGSDISKVQEPTYKGRWDSATYVTAFSDTSSNTFHTAEDEDRRFNPISARLKEQVCSSSLSTQLKTGCSGRTSTPNYFNPRLLGQLMFLLNKTGLGAVSMPNSKTRSRSAILSTIS